MSDSLTERLAERLDLPLEQSDRLIRTLAKIIRTQASRDGQVRVPGMGAFKQSGEALTFEADPLFSGALNPRYARLERLALVTQDAPDLLNDEPPLLETADTSPSDGLMDAMPPSLATEDVFEEEVTPPQWLPEEIPSEDDTIVWPPSDAKVVVSDFPEKDEDPTDVFADNFPTATDSVQVSDVEDELAHPDVEDLASSLLAALPDDTGDAEDEVELATDEEYAPSEWLEEEVEEEDFEDPDLSETAAYEALQEENALFEEDTFLEEEEPSAWAPPGTRWAGEHQDQLVAIEEADMNDEVDEEPSLVSPTEDIQPEADDFAPPTIAAEKVALPPEPRLPKREDLPPRPLASSRYQDNEPPSQRSVWPWLLGALLFVVIAGGAYYFFNLRGPSLATTEIPPPVAPNDATEETTSEEPVTSGENGEAADLESEDPAAQEGRPTPPEGDEETAEPTPPVVEEGTINRATGGYTLVVGSRGSRATAEADAERVRQALNESTIPVDVLEGTANGTTRFRIGVGQVPTVDEAVALKQRLGNRITADAWVTSISPDS